MHFACIGLAAAGLLMLLPLRHDHSITVRSTSFVDRRCMALYIISGKRLGGVPAGPSVAIGMTVTSRLGHPALRRGRGGGRPAGHAVLTTALLVAVASSALPYSLDMVAMRGMPKRTFGVLLSVEPAIGVMGCCSCTNC